MNKRLKEMRSQINKIIFYQGVVIFLISNYTYLHLVRPRTQICADCAILNHICIIYIYVIVMMTTHTCVLFTVILIANSFSLIFELWAA